MTECKYYRDRFGSTPGSSCPAHTLVRSAGDNAVKQIEDIYCINGSCPVSVMMDHRNYLNERRKVVESALSSKVLQALPIPTS